MHESLEESIVILSITRCLFGVWSPSGESVKNQSTKDLYAKLTSEHSFCVVFVIFKSKIHTVNYNGSLHVIVKLCSI